MNKLPRLYSSNLRADVEYEVRFNAGKPITILYETSQEKSTMATSFDVVVEELLSIIPGAFNSPVFCRDANGYYDEIRPWKDGHAIYYIGAKDLETALKKRQGPN